MNEFVSDLKVIADALEAGKITTAEVLSLINKEDEDVINITVDYSKSSDQIFYVGSYGWEHLYITDRSFLLPDKIKDERVIISAKLFHFDRVITSEDAISEMDKAGYRPAIIVELFALGVAYQELQFDIAALASVCCTGRGDRRVPILCFSGSRRSLHLGWLDYDWDGRFRFLAVRK